MFKNYLKIAVRNLKKQRVYSFLNISGLALGLAVFILITMWVQDELSFDQFHKNKNDLYRVILQEIENPDKFRTITSFPLAPALQHLAPEIVNFARVWRALPAKVTYGEKSFNEKKFALADSSCFELFSFKFVQGDSKTALSHPNSIVITEETSKRYFGDDEPLGKVLTRGEKSSFIVTGVIENIPRQSHLQFDLMIRTDFLAKRFFESWEGMDQTYVLLRKGASSEQVNEKIADLFKNRHPDARLTRYRPVLQPVTDVYLNEAGVPGRLKYVYIFSIIAISVLLIACVNFVKLTTARSFYRAKEIGIRKVSGAGRSQLIKQFLSESILYATLAFFIALFIVEISLPAFSVLSEKELSISSSSSFSFLASLIATTLLTGIVSGSYPALYLSGFQPVKVFKGASRTGTGSFVFRKYLVITQFAISIIMIISTWIIHDQLEFIGSKDLGYNKEHVVTIPLNGDYRNHYESLKTELLQNPAVLGVTAATSLPSFTKESMRIDWEGNRTGVSVSMANIAVDHDYLDVFEMKVVQGRAFSKACATDASEAFIINEQALKVMELDSPIGKHIYFDKDGPYADEGVIVGVVKDFHFNSIHEEIEPLVLRIYPRWFFHIMIKVKPENVTAIVAALEKVFKKYSNSPFEYAFLDSAFDDLYKSEHRMAAIFNHFSLIAIFISCLGLFGLAAFTAEQRTKEIGVRKVLGASMTNVAALLSKDFVKLVLLANLIAWPVAWFVMNKWLHNFAYRIKIEWWVFALAGGIALIIALLTVSTQAIKAALANPVEALRYE